MVTQQLLEVLGVRVVEVEGLDVQATFIPARRVGLIRAGLGGWELRRALEYLLAASEDPDR